MSSLSRLSLAQTGHRLTAQDKHEVLSLLRAYHQDPGSPSPLPQGTSVKRSLEPAPSASTLDDLSHALDDVLDGLLAEELEPEPSSPEPSTRDLVDVLNRTIFDLQSFLNTLEGSNTEDMEQLREVIQTFIDDLSVTVRYLLDCRLMSSLTIDWDDELML
jgi:ABC-type transporter Mla subunit MlaD